MHTTPVRNTRRFQTLLRDKFTDAAAVSVLQVSKNINCEADAAHCCSSHASRVGPQVHEQEQITGFAPSNTHPLSPHAIKQYGSHLPDCPSWLFLASDLCSRLSNQLTKCQKHKTVNDGLKQARLKQHAQQRTLNDGFKQARLKQHAQQRTLNDGLKQARLKQYTQQRTVIDGSKEACLKQQAQQSRPHTAC